MLMKNKGIQHLLIVIICLYRMINEDDKIMKLNKTETQHTVLKLINYNMVINQTTNRS